MYLVYRLCGWSTCMQCKLSMDDTGRKAAAFTTFCMEKLTSYIMIMNQ